MVVGIALGAAAAAIIAFYLAPFGAHAPRVPSGFDTPRYIWRSNIVTDHGFRALAEIHVPNQDPLAERAAYPIFAALVHATSGITPLRLAFVLPAVMAVTIGLAAAGFALRGLGDPPWTAPLYALGVAFSVDLARTAIGHGDNLLVDALLVVAALAVVLATKDRLSLIVPVTLLAAALATHWIFAGEFSALVAALALVEIPSSIRLHRAGAPARRTPSGRLGLVLAGAGLSAVGLLLVLGLAHIRIPDITAATLEGKFERLLGPSDLILALLAIGIGVFWLWTTREGLRRTSVALMALWAITVPAAMLAYRTLHLSVPAYRVVGSALGVPVLVLAGLVAGGRCLARASRRWTAVPWGRLVTASIFGLGALGILGLILPGWHAWEQRAPAFTIRQASEAAAVGQYLERFPDRPAIVVVSGPSRVKQDPVLRSLLPTDQIARPHLFVGRSADLLEGHPTIREGNSITAASEATFREVRPLLEQHPIILALASFGRPVSDTGPGVPIAPGVTLVEGPPPTGPIRPAPFPSPSDATRIMDAAFVLVLLFGVGIGWSRVLRGRSFDIARVALSPGLGLAALVLVGVVGGSLGLDLGGAPGIVLVLVTAAAGWIPSSSRGAGPDRGTAAMSGTIPPRPTVRRKGLHCAS
ncbi:MAG TPA: hypothetical protein VE646_03395 [Actinomycetota bacterium]|nr:hypothetical protein [Actinomycetota bacterium]